VEVLPLATSFKCPKVARSEFVDSGLAMFSLLFKGLIRCKRQIGPRRRQSGSLRRDIGTSGDAIHSSADGAFIDSARARP
jgi:hypothetical protein